MGSNHELWVLEMDTMTPNEPACMIQGKPEDVIGSHQSFNSGGAVDKVLDTKESDGSFTVQVQFKNAAASGPSPTSAEQRSAHLSFQAFLHLSGAECALKHITSELRELRDQAIRAQLTVIKVKGQEPFHNDPGLCDGDGSGKLRGRRSPAEEVPMARLPRSFGRSESLQE